MSIINRLSEDLANLRGTWRSVDKDDRQANREHPDCLKDPKYRESERIWSLVVEAIVFSYLDDPVEEVAGQPQAPEDDASRDDDLPPLEGLGQTEAQHGQHYKVGAAGKVRHLQRRDDVRIDQSKSFSFRAFLFLPSPFTTSKLLICCPTCSIYFQIPETDLIKLECGRHQEEGELHPRSDNGADGQVVGVSLPDNHHDRTSLLSVCCTPN